MAIKMPCSVIFRRSCSEWHEQSRPAIADATGRIVIDIPQYVDHPGMYDRTAVEEAFAITKAINTKHDH